MISQHNRSKRIGDLQAALDDLLVNAPADKLKFKELPVEVEEVTDVPVVDYAKKQDVSEFWIAAHTALVYLKEAKEIQKRLKSKKSKNDVISLETKLHAILLRIEETTSKLYKVRHKYIPTLNKGSQVNSR